MVYGLAADLRTRAPKPKFAGGYAVLTGGSEAEKRRVQQDFLYARAQGALGRDIFPQIDPLTGLNISKNYTFLRPEQVAALRAPGAAIAGLEAAGSPFLGGGGGQFVDDPYGPASTPPAMSEGFRMPSTTVLVVIGAIVILALMGGVRASR